MFKQFVLRFFRLAIKSKVLFLFSLIVLGVMGAIYMHSIWALTMEETTNQALALAATAEASFQKNVVGSLEGKPSDLEKKEYIQIKNSLIKLRAINDDIRFAYIYTQKEGKAYFLADSEPQDSIDYSPPGQEYTEADEMYLRPFQDGKPVVSQPVTDRWGTWVSVLVPMKDLITGKIIAVLGMDYPAESWSDKAIIHTGQAGIVVLCLFLILLFLRGVIIRNKIIKEEKNKLFSANEKLREKEELFRTIYEQAPIGISIGNNNNYIIDTNSKFESIVGRRKEELVALGWEKFTHPDDIQKDLDSYMKTKLGAKNGYSMNKRYIRPDASVVWVNMTIAPLRVGKKSEQNHLCLVEDITERLKAEADLRESERSKTVLLSNLPGMAYRCSYDLDRTMQYVSDGCFELTGYKAESLVHNKQISFTELIRPEYRDHLLNKRTQVLKSRQVFRDEYQIITASGENKWVLEQGQGIFDENGKVEAIEGLIIDITDRKIQEDEIRYLNYHDFLTGLHNRRFMEIERHRLDNESRLPLSIIIGDINGLKLINDAFGHAEGDKLITETAKIMQSCCRKEDVLARTGGDEFCILLPQTDNQAAFNILEKIKRTCAEYNRNIPNEAYYINISLGHSTKKSVHESMDKVIKKAEDYMYKGKLLEQKSSHSALILSIKATMFERSQETEEHAERLSLLSKKVGMKLNLSQTELNDLELLATLHDIGKVGIDDRILNKPGQLSEEEWVEMKKHPEIGYRIAISSPELVPIAEYILYHHERWDGRGYPQGLKGEETPLPSRILAIVDAFDAMTQDRIYRKALTEEAAIAELRNNAGTQFDPNITNLFIEKVLKEIKSNTKGHFIA